MARLASVTGAGVQVEVMQEQAVLKLSWSAASWAVREGSEWERDRGAKQREQAASQRVRMEPVQKRLMREEMVW